MITLIDSSSGAAIGPITPAQLKALTDWMEEESEEDRDYYVSGEELDIMEQDGVDPSLIALLRQALGGREDMDIRYERETE